MTKLTRREARELKDDSLRAIGRYVVEFSLLIATMRDIVAWYLSEDRRSRLIGRLVLGEANPSHTADAFFGVCRAVGELDTEEERIAASLRSAVRKTIEKRNDVAHGDWWVGLVADDEERLEPASLVRFRPARAEGVERIERLSASDLDELSASLNSLGRLVQEFGVLSLGLLVWGPRPGRTKSIYRVGEVLAWKDGLVTRNGPYAVEAPRLLYLHEDEPGD
jgi:hypothetical protein